MTKSAVEIVRSQTDERCHVSLCCDSGCCLIMDHAPVPNVLVHLEHPKSPIDRSCTHCDFLFVGGGQEDSTEWVAPIELTTGEDRSRKFKRQLQPGAKLAERLIPNSIEVKFRPVAVHDRENPRISERRRRKRTEFFIKFRNKEYPPKVVRCGTPLSVALFGNYPL